MTERPDTLHGFPIGWSFQGFAAEWRAGAPEREAKQAEINEHFDRHYAGRPKPWEVI